MTFTMPEPNPVIPVISSFSGPSLDIPDHGNQTELLAIARATDLII